ncbi:nuclear transport factor 2 family protein [Gordonia hankookensis]|uniref:Nuclear transport factor 2 family protein n=1 Tax=Gordonia hankookensis TaxID=589403 RepID=A0ABR7WH52_9ACTN|nr:nuclear transport factor 2 family protein [Gordonia hankookensis]MBD1322099.1 nuclear transport factor 2 family protein [Gordonia hankookensis]NDZ97013.1 nuclear transport factor 2 family protein [Streptomyces sp. SID11726]NEB26201.1 nuclear transport factor 2 family protein [Streptomyces sp. SID6673]
MTDHADHDAICTLLYRYAELLDGGDFAAVGELFADADIALRGEVTGRGAAHVRAMFEAMVIVHPDGTPRTRHLITNPIIEFDGPDHAHVRSCYTVLQQRDGRIEIVASGRHLDTVTRRAEGWIFSSRDYGYLDFVGDTSDHLRASG